MVAVDRVAISSAPKEQHLPPNLGAARVDVQLALFTVVEGSKRSRVDLGVSLLVAWWFFSMHTLGSQPPRAACKLASCVQAGKRGRRASVRSTFGKDLQTS